MSVLDYLPAGYQHKEQSNTESLKELDKILRARQNQMQNLILNDGKSLGRITSKGFSALQNNEIDQYTPVNDEEKRTLDNYKNYVVQKAQEQQDKQLAEYKAQPVFQKYGIDPTTFDMNAFEKWADEHNFVKNTQDDEPNQWVPKRKGDFLNIYGLGGKELATEEDKQELEKLKTLAEQNEIRKGWDTKEAFFMNFGDGLTMGLTPKVGDKVQTYLEKESDLYDYVPENRRVTTTEALNISQQKHPIASTTGAITGSLVPLMGVSNVVGAATKSIPWIANMPRWAQAAINSGITFSAISTAETANEGGTPEEILRNAGINFVGGSVGGSLGSIVGDIGTKILFNQGIQNRIIPELVRAGLSSAAFAGGKTASTYYLYPEEYRPSAEEIAKDLGVAFAFGTISSGMQTVKATAANKQILNRLYQAMGRDYEMLVKTSTSGKSDIATVKKSCRKGNTR